MMICTGQAVNGNMISLGANWGWFVRPGTSARLDLEDLGVNIFQLLGQYVALALL